MSKQALEILVMEYKKLRSELSELRKTPERWGMIMLPLSTAVLAVAVNSMETLPNVGVVMLAFLSIATIAIWRLIAYSTHRRRFYLVERIRRIQAEILSPVERESFGRDWSSFYLQSPFLRFLSVHTLLNIFASLYITAAVAIIIVKYTSS